MDDLTKFALMKSFEKDLKDFIAPQGTHPINAEVNLRIEGKVVKGCDQEYTPTTSIPLALVVALLLEKSGIQRERSKKLLIECMQEAMNASSNIKERLNDVEEAMKHVKEITAALPKKVRSGPTSVNVSIEEV